MEKGKKTINNSVARRRRRGKRGDGTGKFVEIWWYESHAGMVAPIHIYPYGRSPESNDGDC